MDAKERMNPAALYVYDRVCTKRSKMNEISRTYGRSRMQARTMDAYEDRPFGEEASGCRNTGPNGARTAGPNGSQGTRPFGSRTSEANDFQSARPFGSRTSEANDFQSARPFGSRTSEANDFQRARPFGVEFAEAQRRRAEEAGYGRRRQSGNAYSYRPGSAEGGEAVKSRPFKLMIDRLVDFFDSVEDKVRRDEAIARKHAVAWKKLYEYKHIITTSLVLLAVTALFAFVVYQIFFVVQDVRITGAGMYSESEIMLSAGFEVGDNLYSFAGNEAEEAITFLCPYIKSAEIERTVPKTVNIMLEEDTPAYFAVIWGDCVKLSAGLRVLEMTDRASITAEDGLIELVLPPVKYSVAGRVIEFCDQRDERVVRSVLAEAASSALLENGMIDEIDLSNEYGITVESCGRYLLKMGGETDMDLKLRMAYKTLTNDQFDDLLPARIDLSEVGRAAILPDASLDLGD